MDEFSYLSVLISHPRSRRYANFEGVPGNFAIAGADHASDGIWSILLPD